MGTTTTLTLRTDRALVLRGHRQTPAPRRTLEDDLLDLLAHHGLEAWRAMEAADDRRYNARDAADADRRWHASVCGRLAVMVAGL